LALLKSIELKDKSEIFEPAEYVCPDNGVLLVRSDVKDVSVCCAEDEERKERADKGEAALSASAAAIRR